MNSSHHVAAVLACAVCAYQPSPSAAAPARVTLCAPNEAVLFRCAIGRKTVSVCATPDLTSSSGSVFYRFGTLKRMELTYPTEEKHPSTAFDASFDHWAKGHASEISFTVGDLTYVVNEYSSSLAGYWAGVAVYRGNQRIAKLACSDYPDNNLFLLEELGLEPVGPHLDLLP